MSGPHWGSGRARGATNTAGPSFVRSRSRERTAPSGTTARMRSSFPLPGRGAARGSGFLGDTRTDPCCPRLVADVKAYGSVERPRGVGARGCGRVRYRAAPTAPRPQSVARSSALFYSSSVRLMPWGSAGFPPPRDSPARSSVSKTRISTGGPELGQHGARTQYLLGCELFSRTHAGRCHRAQANRGPIRRVPG